MSMSRVIYTILIAISAGCGYYLYTKAPEKVINILPNVEFPAFSGTMVDSVSYTESGTRSYTIISSELENFAKQGITVFQDPILKIYVEGVTQEWEISADKAILGEDEVLTLYSNVLAENLLPESAFDTLSTVQMSIKLTNRDFWTDNTVTLLGPQFTTVGQAMKGNFADNTAVLFNHVKGKYETITP